MYVLPSTTKVALSAGDAGHAAAFGVPATCATPGVPDLTPSVNVIVGAVVAVAESLVNSSVVLVRVSPA